MKKLILVSLAICSLIACSKSEDKKRVTDPADPNADSRPLQDARNSAQAEADGIIDDAAPSYSSSNLKLLFPHDKNWGWIRIEGNDAKKLFESLKLKTGKSKGNVVWNPARIKQGIQLVCIEEAMKVSPENLEDTCSFYINYRKGSVNKAATSNEMDLKAPNLSSEYVGELIQLKAKDSVDSGTLTLEGPDAQALYTTIKTEISDIPAEGSLLAGKMKRGEDIECRLQAEKSAPEKALHKCTILFNPAIGTVKSLSK